MLDFFDEIISHLTNEDLAKMSHRIKEEQKKRIIANIENYPIPSKQEMAGFKGREKMAALASYHKRTSVSYQEVLEIFAFFEKC